MTGTDKSTHPVTTTVRRARAIGYVLALACIATPAQSEDPPAAPQPTAYRRMFVPVDNMPVWPRDGRKYLPVDVRDFDAWIAAANQPAAGAPAARIVDAEYAARLEGNQLVDGRASWSIELRGDKPALLPLGQMALVVREPAWSSDSALPVRWGLWGGRDVYGLQVPHADTLTFAWHADPTEQSSGTLAFPLHLPPASRQRLTLDLPADKRPALDGSVVVDSTPVDAEDPAATTNWRRWVLAVGESSTTRLRIEERRSEPALTQPTTVLHEESVYRIDQRGLAVVATLRLDSADRNLSRLTVKLAPGLHLLSAQADSRKLSWRIVGDALADGTRAVVQLPSLPSEGRTLVTLRAWAPLVTDDRWTLPTLRPEGVFWSSGSMKITIDPLIELRDLTLADCVQTGVIPASSSSIEPETLQFEAYSPAASLDVVVGIHRPAVSARRGTTLQIGDAGITGRVVTQLDVDRGSLHSLAATIQSGWSVDSVQTVPTGALADWYVGSVDRRPTLRVQLADAAMPGRPVTVVVNAHLHRTTASQPIAARTLSMLQWQDTQIVRHLLLLQPSEPYELDSLGRLAPLGEEDLADADRQLFEDSTAGHIVDLLSATPDASVRWAPMRGAYDATMQLDATLENELLRQTWKIACQPHGAGVERLRVYVSQPLGENFAWREADSQELLPAERVAEDDPRWEQLPADGQLWELRLGRPFLRAVTIEATTATPWTERQGVPLLSLPDAADQQARILVRTVGAGGVELDQRGLNPVPLPTDSAADPSPVDGARIRAAFRYDPSDVTRDHWPQLWLRPSSAGGSGTKPFAQQVQIESIYAIDGQASHRVTYQIHNRGASRVDFRLPPGARLESARVGGRPIAWQQADEDPDSISIAQPAEEKVCELKLEFRTQEAPLAHGRVLAPPLRDDDLPLLSGAWTVWLPEGYAAEGTPIGKEIINPSSRSPLPSVGWHASETTFVAAPPSPVLVAHAATATAWSMAIFLVAAIGGAWLAGHRATYFIALAAAAAALRLLLSATFAPLATGALLGLLFSLVLRATVRSHPRPPSDTTWSRPQKAPAVATTAVVLLSLLIGLGVAQPPAAAEIPEQPAEPTIHTVLVPVSDDGRPAGTKYYVSEEFLRTLLARGTDATRASDWLLSNASYSGELKQASGQSGIVPGAWIMALDVEVLARDTTVLLPLVRGEANWEPTASLDGIPVPIVWQEGGRGCSIAVTEPGRYQLSLSFMPRVTRDAGRAQVHLSIPPLLSAKFQLACPPELTDCQVPGHHVVRTSGTAADLLSAELAAENRLLVSWPESPASPSSVAQPQVAELLWLQVTREGIRLDAKYLLAEGERPIETLSVVADKRWELLTDPQAAAVGSIDMEPGQVQTIRVHLSDAAAEVREVLLRFRLRNEHVLGRHRFPEVGLASPAPANRWLAVGCDPSLECEATLNQGLASSEEFVSVWGDVAEPPQMVFANAGDLGSWDLAVRPRTASSAIDQRLHVAAGREALRLQYEAQVQPAAGTRLLNAGSRCYRFELSVPPNLSINTIAVHEAEYDVPFRWAAVDIGADRRVNVFFDRPIEGPYRLVLTGSVPVGESGLCAVPRVVAPAAEQTTQQVVLYRQPEADVQLREFPQTDLSRDQPDELPPYDWSARQVGVYELDKQTIETARIAVSARRTDGPTEPATKPNDRQALADPSPTAETTPTPRSALAPVPSESPSVRLVDTVALTDEAGGQILVSRFVLAPNGLLQCVLRLPEEQQLISAKLDDQPALLEPIGANQWRVLLGPPDLPQSIEVISRVAGPLHADGRAIDLLRPTLLADGLPIPVELTLWSVSYPQTNREPLVNEATLVTPEELNAVRLDRLVGVAEAATESVRQLPEPDGRNWLLRWTRRLAAVRYEGHAPSAWPDAAAPSSQVPQLADRQLAEAASRMDVWLEQVQDLFADREFEGTLKTPATPKRLDRWPGAADGQRVYCLAGGDTRRLRLELSPVGLTSAQIRFAGLVAILGVAAAAVWLVHRPAAWDVLWRWPHAAGVLLGLVCWAWLGPPWIGLGIVAGSLVLLVWRGWPARTVYAEGTTVLRSHRRP